MNRIFITNIMLFCCISIIQAQKTHEIEPAILECQYEHTKIIDTLDYQKNTQDLMILRIGKNVSEFFSYYTLYSDSLWNDPQGKIIAGKMAVKAIRERKYSEMPFCRTTNAYIYVNYPKGKTSTYDRLYGNECVVIEEDNPAFQWIITDSTKTICSYTCQLATTDFRGRTYKAWFTPEIPISAGPWKLSGLPGLILEAYDIRNHYRYTLIGINQNNLKPVTFYNYYDFKYEKMDRIKFLKETDKIRKDPHPMRTMKARTGISFSEDSPSSERPKHAYDFLERDYR